MRKGESAGLGCVAAKSRLRAALLRCGAFNEPRHRWRCSSARESRGAESSGSPRSGLFLAGKSQSVADRKHASTAGSSYRLSLMGSRMKAQFQFSEDVSGRMGAPQSAPLAPLLAGARARGMADAFELLGVAAALAAGRLLGRLVAGVRPAEPLTFTVMVSVLVLAALFASFLPARRASRMDPVSALRQE